MERGCCRLDWAGTLFGSELRVSVLNIENDAVRTVILGRINFMLNKLLHDVSSVLVWKGSMSASAINQSRNQQVRKLSSAQDTEH